MDPWAFKMVVVATGCAIAVDHYIPHYIGEFVCATDS